MLSWMLWSNNELKVYHKNQVNSTSNMKLATSLIIFNVSHVEYLMVFHSINKLKPLLLLSLQILQGSET